MGGGVGCFGIVGGNGGRRQPTPGGVTARPDTHR